MCHWWYQPNCVADRVIKLRLPLIFSFLLPRTGHYLWSKQLYQLRHMMSNRQHSSRILCIQYKMFLSCYVTVISSKEYTVRWNSVGKQTRKFVKFSDVPHTHRHWHIHGMATWFSGRFRSYKQEVAYKHQLYIIFVRLFSRIHALKKFKIQLNTRLCNEIIVAVPLLYLEKTPKSYRNEYQVIK